MLSAVILLVACFLYWTWYSRRLPGEPPALPGSWPFIGHGHLFFGDPLYFWKQAQKTTRECMELGHACSMHLGPRKWYVITDPDDINKVSNTCLQKDEVTCEFAKDLLGGGLMFSPVPMWKRHRKLINPAFNQQVLDGYLPIFNSQARRMVTQLEAELGSGPFDHSSYVRKNFMEAICATAFDESITPEEAEKYVKSLETVMNCNFTRFFRPWLYPDFLFKLSSLKRKLNEAVKILDHQCESVLQKKRTQRKQIKSVENNEELSEPKVKVLMDILMDLDGGVLTDREIRDEINTFIVAGYDANASVIAFVFVVIGSYPHVQEKLFKELQEVFGDTDRDVAKQDLSKLVYLEAVLKETMRYYIITPFIRRYVDQDVQLKNYTLKAGYNCTLGLYGVHRNESLWGPDADEFKPERWLDPATLPSNPNAYAAFSIGKRNCIGKNHAMMAMKTLMSHVLRRYRIHADHTKLEVMLHVLLRPAAGNHLSIEDRLKPIK